MSLDKSVRIRQDILEMLKNFSGRKQEPRPDELIGKDLLIRGGDSVQLLDELEDLFSVDLNPLVNRNVTYMEANWWDRLRGKRHGPAQSDVRVDELIEYILENS